MTIESTVNDGISYSGNDSATNFPFPFKVNSATQVEVIIRDAAGVETTLTTGYTVNNPTVEGSGSVDYPTSGSPLATGSKISINPKMDYKQETDIRNQGRFDPQIHEAAFDTLMMHIKELRGVTNRAIHFKKSSEITGALFDDDPQDGYGIIWDGTTGKMRNTASSLAVLEGDAAIVAGAIDSVNTVADDLIGDDTIGQILAIQTEIEGVYAIRTDVVTVAGIAAAVSAVAANATNINAVNSNATNINTVAGISGNVTTVAGIAANVTTVAGIAANVTSVAGNATNINTVASNSTNINTVAGISAAVSTVAGISSAVSTVSTNAAAVSTVATNITSVNTVSTNIADVNSLATNIVELLLVDDNAAIAEAARDDALAAQAATEAARDATLASFDSFDDRYLGAKSSDPTLDNDGDALVAGTLYYNTVDEAMKIYTGSIWVAAYVSGTDFLARANNLSDLSSAAAARTNLGLVIGTNVQAFHASLLSIAGLTTAANKMIYTTGSDAYAVTDLSAFGRTLIDDADATAAKVTLGLVIGTNVQAADATLTSIAAIAGVQGDLMYASGTDAWARLAKDANATRYLSNTGASNNPAWAQVNLTNGVTGTLPAGNGGTGNAFTAFTGAASATKTYTLPNATCSILTTNAAVTVAQGGTGLATLTANNVMLGNGTSTPQFVAPGTSGNVLTSNGTTWQSSAPAGAFVYISEQVASSSASLDFTASMSSAYSKYIFECIDIRPASAAAFAARVNTGGGYISTSTYKSGGIGRGHESTGYTIEAVSAQAEISGFTCDSSADHNFIVEVVNPSSSKITRMRCHAEFKQSGIDREFSGNSMSLNTTTSPVTGIQFLFPGVNITSGKVRMYGVL